MASCNMKYQFTLVLFFMLCVFGNSDTEKDKEECTQSLIGLATCLPYVTANAPAPTPDCCTGLKQVLKASKKCLCLLIKDRNDPDLGLNLNVTLALSLPSVCQAPANISQCPALLHLPPNSPDAQVFYQISNGSSSIASSPQANSPIPSVGSSPTGAPAGAASAPKSNDGCHIGKRWFALDAILGVVLLWSLTSNFFI
ncbi:non-specific lipid transfer protein GPI-anchored 14 [Nicotiana tabacum]|uniref:Non-specific lipid transfer protein GPI-anchored 14 n=1 Tax=Nicotiana tabacum TaxID=4097 RepID=A0A1S3YY41_TOBAC|nr:PREDICTED: protein YLS3-like isoform X1 [Nicotiana tabacum]